MRSRTLTFVAVAGLMMPATAATFAYYLIGIQSLNYRYAVLAVGAIPGALLLAAYLWRLHADDRELWNELWREVVFLIRHGDYAWCVGIGLGLIACSLYVALPLEKNGSLGERLASAFTLYVGIVTAVLGLHSLYRRTAPITSIDLLLDHLVHDLRKYLPHRSRLLFVFPALNIGYYRAVKRYGYQAVPSVEAHVPPESPYMQFTEALLRWVRAKCPTRVYTYPISLYRGLFKAYEDQQSANDTALLELCVSEATELVKLVRASDAASVVEVRPNVFPAQVIVIGPVCYTILSYGLPRLISTDDNADTFAPAGSKAATLVVYRREDATLAETVYEEVTQEVARLLARDGTKLIHAVAD